MIKINTKSIHPDLRQLLSYATSLDKIDQEYEKYVSLNERSLYVLESKGSLIGCIGIEIISSNLIEIKHIAVSSSERGKGRGSQMIDFVCAHFSFCRIQAETDRDAVEFYRKYGFKIKSLGEKYPGVERFMCELTNDRSINND
ncbi:GNAT family N-acetyltransferase [Psychrobacillus sp. FJAT-51614]|uniref:GNAT family N-acetyltransferase n=1 Tax=Psychrobacillus mangrovi TaxID=3117745 RepID=A0ABU8F7E6_9BACI